MWLKGQQLVQACGPPLKRHLWELMAAKHEMIMAVVFVAVTVNWKARDHEEVIVKRHWGASRSLFSSS